MVKLPTFEDRDCKGKKEKFLIKAGPISVGVIITTESKAKLFAKQMVMAGKEKGLSGTIEVIKLED